MTDTVEHSRIGRRVARWAVPASAVLGLVVFVVWFRPPVLGGGTSYVIVSGDSMRPNLRPGDLVIVREQDEYRIGDVLAYRIPDGPLEGGKVIHRVVGGSATDGFVLRGDNKTDLDLWRPGPADVIGRAGTRIPHVGRILDFARSPAVLAAVAAGFAFAFVFTYPARRPEASSD